MNKWTASGIIAAALLSGCGDQSTHPNSSKGTQAVGRDHCLVGCERDPVATTAMKSSNSNAGADAALPSADDVAELTAAGFVVAGASDVKNIAGLSLLQSSSDNASEQEADAEAAPVAPEASPAEPAPEAAEEGAATDDVAALFEDARQELSGLADITECLDALKAAGDGLESLKSDAQVREKCLPLVKDIADGARPENFAARFQAHKERLSKCKLEKDDEAGAPSDDKPDFKPRRRLPPPRRADFGDKSCLAALPPRSEHRLPPPRLMPPPPGRSKLKPLPPPPPRGVRPPPARAMALADYALHLVADHETMTYTNRYYLPGAASAPGYRRGTAAFFTFQSAPDIAGCNAAPLHQIWYAPWGTHFLSTDAGGEIPGGVFQWSLGYVCTSEVKGTGELIRASSQLPSGRWQFIEFVRLPADWSDQAAMAANKAYIDNACSTGWSCAHQAWVPLTKSF